MDAYLHSQEDGQRKKLFNFKRTPTKNMFIFGAIGSLYVLKQWYNSMQHNKEVELRKQRIRLPVYHLSEEEMINPPWVDNYDEWKYRRVAFKGRYVFRYSAYIPNKINNYQGYEFLVPIITQEDEKLENRKGLIVNKGWLPHEVKDPSERLGFEDSRNYKDVVGVVNKGEHYKKKGWKTFFQKGNVSDEQQFEINNFDLDFIAKVSEFKNKESMSQAVVELIDYQDGDKLNQYDPNTFQRDLSMTKTYPFVRTGSDFLKRGNQNDFIKIFVTTDNHLGYKFDDPILKKDPFVNFKEALKIAQKEHVDFVFFLGDLFDVSKPNYECIDLTLDIMDKTIGKKIQIGQIYNCDQAQRYKLNNHSIPALLIHGNHDRPHNQDIFEIKYRDNNIRGCLDLLERFQVVKYIGREIDHNSLNIEPFIIQKKNIQIGVYAFGYTQDDKLNKNMRNNTLNFKKMGDFDQHILIIHQNRLQGDQHKNLKPHLKLDLLNKYKFDLILWGHEHEAKKELEVFRNQYNFKIYQPGSTVATSIRPSEAVTKSVGIFKFYKNFFDLQIIDLKKPRKVLILEFDLEQTQSQFNQQFNTLEEQIADYIICHLQLTDQKTEKLPLVRVKLLCEKSIDLDKYQLDYKIKKYTANKKSIIVLKRKKRGMEIENQKFQNKFDIKSFQLEHKDEYSYEKLQNKFENDKMDLKVLNEKIYFQIMKAQDNQAQMVNDFLNNVYDNIETEMQITQEKCLQKQDYLQDDIDDILDCDEKLREFQNKLQEDIDQAEFVNQETIELTHKMLNKKTNLQNFDDYNQIKNTKIQLKTQNFEQQKRVKSSGKKFRKSRRSKNNYQLIQQMKQEFVKFEVHGKVQGVYFRKYTKEQARKLDIKGWCQNTDQGTVIGEIEGPSDKIDEMINWLKNIGSPESMISKLDVKERKDLTDKSKIQNMGSFKIIR